MKLMMGALLIMSLIGADGKASQDIEGEIADHADLSGVNLTGRDLSGADLDRSDLSHSSLNHSDLSHAALRSAWLMGSDLRGADLKFVTIMEADLRGADLKRVKYDSFTLQQLLNAELDGAIMSDDLEADLEELRRNQ